jgi:hypothetical protein
MKVWPAELPNWIMAEGYGEAPAGNIAEFQPEVGPPKRRRRTSIDMVNFSAGFLTNSTGVDALMGFYRDDLADGVLEFQKPHPRTGVTMVCIMSSPPSISALGGDNYRVSMQLMKLY